MTSAKSKWTSAVAYTGLRVLLWLVLWAVLQFLTPIKGLLAVVLSLLISSAISIIVLDRQRDVMSAAVGEFFSGINQRIENSATAEDAWERGRDEQSQPGEHGSGGKAIDEHEHPGLLERDDQLRSERAAEDDADGTQR